MQEHLTIVVVGGGLAGLLSGIRLANDGHSVTVSLPSVAISTS